VLRERLDAPLSVHDLCQRLGLGYEQFRKAFRVRYGRAPAAYRKTARLDRARELLAGSELAVGTIAQRVGYSEIFAFSKAFTAATALSPSRYRASFRLGRHTARHNPQQSIPRRHARQYSQA
jgi:transcriptional regulator GlxA family with amidase domain